MNDHPAGASQPPDDSEYITELDLYDMAAGAQILYALAHRNQQPFPLPPDGSFPGPELKPKQEA